jgi:hypothetical protein
MGEFMTWQLAEWASITDRMGESECREQAEQANTQLPWRFKGSVGNGGRVRVCKDFWGKGIRNRIMGDKAMNRTIERLID